MQRRRSPNSTPFPSGLIGRFDRIAQNRSSLRDRHFAALVEALPAAIYVTDREGRLIFFNQAAVALWGVRPVVGEATWCGSWKLYWPGGAPMPHSECPMAVALKESRAVRGQEVVAERPDGARVPLLPYPTPIYNVRGRLTGGINMLVDITEQKAAERALKDIDERYRLTVEAARDCAVYMLDSGGIVASWNAGAERVHNCRAEEIIGSHFSILSVLDGVGKPEQLLEAAAQQGKCSVEHWRTRRDGAPFLASDLVTALFDSEGLLRGYAVVTQDVTERRKLENERAAYLHEVEELNARLKRAMTETHHRVKNNLHAVSAMIDMMTGYDREAVPAGELRRLSLYVRSLGAVHDVLTSEARKDGTAEWASVAEMLQHAVSALEHPLGVHRLEMHVDDIRVPARFATSLALVANELTNNALKHGSGKVIVSFSVRQGGATLMIQDEGKGYPAHFDPAPDNTTGVALVNSLIKWDLNGAVRFYNGNAGGAVAEVSMRLPANEESGAHCAGTGYA
ncbi:MAG TPA: PAS domain S-box protein [Chthonomonadales bacterium]|nr:PAS domain S-box protein [Chthonomonadales bacterium]